jgi:hypothetical protein
LAADATFCQLCFAPIGQNQPAPPPQAPASPAYAAPGVPGALQLGSDTVISKSAVDWLDVTIWIFAAIWLLDGALYLVPGLMAEFKSRALGGHSVGAVPVTMGIVSIMTGIGLFFGQAWGYGLAKLICYLRILVCVLLIPLVLNVAPILAIYPVFGIAFCVTQLWVLSKAS